jgi:pyruvate dehydrogenase E1 component
MFGFQRVGDLIWQNADQRSRGFLIGATAGRTTLAGEGLQHQDGHSHVLASVVPTVRAYDPAYAYEIAIIVKEGIRRMYEAGEDCFYYLTVQNEMYEMRGLPGDGDERTRIRDGVLKGMYLLEDVPAGSESKPKVHLFGSSAILRSALRARELLAERGVAATVWSVTSYLEMRRDALAAERWNRLHPEGSTRTPWITSQLADRPWPIIAVSDYMKVMADQLARFVPAGLTPLGTDGFGRSDERHALRRHFEVDAESVTVAALAELARRGEVPRSEVARALRDFQIDADKVDPAVA